MSLLVKRMIYLYIEFPLTIQSPSLHTHIVRTQCVNTQHSRTVDSSPYLSAAPLTCGTEPLASTLTYFSHSLLHWLTLSLLQTLTALGIGFPASLLPLTLSDLSLSFSYFVAQIGLNVLMLNVTVAFHPKPWPFWLSSFSGLESACLKSLCSFRFIL